MLQNYEQTGTVTLTEDLPDPQVGLGSETLTLGTVSLGTVLKLPDSNSSRFLYCYFLIKKTHQGEQAGQRQEALPGPLLPHSGSG